MRSEEHQQRINQINSWVDQYKDGDMEAGNNLLLQFQPFLKKQCNRWDKVYQGVLTWDHALHEANTLFYNLLNEYTVGGPAYFNVFIERKLPLRLRYCYIKEIKRRQRDLSHSDEQMMDDGLIGSCNDIEEFVDNEDKSDRLRDIYEALDGEALSDRERDMVTRHILKGESHTSIAEGYGLSRSRVSRIITNAIEKLQYEVRYR